MDRYGEIVKRTVRDLFDVDVVAELTRPEPQFGDYATNVAMRLAKPLHQNPHQIAEQIKNALEQTGKFSEVAIAGPGFINLRVAAKSLHDELESGFRGSLPYGDNDDGAGKKVLVEYPSTNMAKPFSVGHLRSANQGWAARNLMLATGWQVITDNHLGDYGSPFGIWVVGFRKFSSEAKLKERGIYELGDIYIKTKKAMKDEAAVGRDDLERESQEWLLKLEAGDPEAVDYSERFNKISLDHIHKVMGRLHISTDYELGEKFFAEKGKEEVKKLLADGIAIQNPDGSVIVPLDEYGIKTPMLVLKSNGAALYATTDLATLLYRDWEFHVDRVIYCVASEQKFYFQQLFALAKKIGLKTELIHMWYGLIDQINDDGTRSKMSSRQGVVLLESLLDRAEQVVRDGNPNLDEADVKKIAVGAIKFNDFSNDRRTGMLFNWKTMFSLTGFSGPYVQYAAVRVNKILRDNEFDANKIDFTADYDYEPEKQVILKLLDYPGIVKLAADNLEPHRLALYVFELAKVLNKYYETTPVATSGVPDGVKNARLGVLSRVAYVFRHALGILGIEVPSRM